jgi:hypothetical protein
VAKRERHIDELYAEDPERADAQVFGRRTDVSRRGFLGGAGLAAMSAAVGGSIVNHASMPGGMIPAAFAQDAKKAAPAPAAPAAAAPQKLSFPGKDPGLVVLGDRPLVAETPEHLLDDDTTPTAKFFIRNNGQIPEPAKEPDAWKLSIDGEVNKPMEFTLADLKKRAQPRTYRMVLECGGNGRSFFTPQARGNQWTNGGAAARGRCQAVGRLYRQLRHRCAPLRRPQARDAVARGARGQGHERVQHGGVGHERGAAGQHPRCSSAPGDPRLAGFRIAQMAVEDHAAQS